MKVSMRGEGAVGATNTLPDVNAETYPYERVQQLLDETLSLSLCAVPNPDYSCRATLVRDSADDYFGINGGYGIDFESTLHRFEAVPRYDSGSARLAVTQPAGEAVGRLHCRCLFAPSDAKWRPGVHPRPTIYDPWRSQRLIAVDCQFTFGYDSFQGYAIGRTYPAVVDHEPYVLLGAVGNFMEGTGQFEGLEGTFVCAGQFTPSLGFAGNVTCRIVDPENHVRTDREMPSMTGIHEPFADQTFIVMRGVKRDRTVRTTYGPPPGPDLVSLITPSQMRSLLTEPVTRERIGLQVGSTVGPTVATMEADVSFNIAAPPGTARNPVPFETKELYTFMGEDGRSCGTVRAAVTDGISFGLKFPAAPRQGGVRFAGFGPIIGGTGQFDGAQGLLTVNSVIGIAPHALSLLHVLHFVDPAGKLRMARRRGPSMAVAGRAETHLAPEFEPLLVKADQWAPRYIEWREGVRQHADAIACFAAAWYEQHLHIGDFPGLHIDGDNLSGIFQKPVGPFNAETFNRYGGPARGEFRQYDLCTKREYEDEKGTLYSVWAPQNVLRNGRVIKQITGSFRQYFPPTRLPNLGDGLVDIILNSYRDDLGVTSWVEIYQRVRQQRTSFAYTLPHPHEVLWFVKDVSLNGKAVNNNVWMLSHEWKGERNGRTCYFMVGFFTEIDFDTGEIKLFGNRFWRALYEESK